MKDWCVLFWFTQFSWFDLFVDLFSANGIVFGLAYILYAIKSGWLTCLPVHTAWNSAQSVIKIWKGSCKISVPPIVMSNFKMIFILLLDGFLFPPWSHVAYGFRKIFCCTSPLPSSVEDKKWSICLLLFLLYVWFLTKHFF